MEHEPYLVNTNTGMVIPWAEKQAAKNYMRGVSAKEFKDLQVTDKEAPSARTAAAKVVVKDREERHMADEVAVKRGEEAARKEREEAHRLAQIPPDPPTGIAARLDITDEFEVDRNGLYKLCDKLKVPKTGTNDEIRAALRARSEEVKALAAPAAKPALDADTPDAPGAPPRPDKEPAPDATDEPSQPVTE